MSTIDVLKALADETRLRIVSLLVEADDLCACEIEAILRINQSNASRHLTRLRVTQVLSASKRGQWVHYSITEGSSVRSHLAREIVQAGRQDPGVLDLDLNRLADYRRSGFSCTTIKQWIASSR
jgi:ArsR family transcriptional regulator, arsenate/arsenite/antimonite-responsive transcriptional repressor